MGLQTRPIRLAIVYVLHLICLFTCVCVWLCVCVFCCVCVRVHGCLYVCVHVCVLPLQPETGVWEAGQWEDRDAEALCYGESNQHNLCSTLNQSTLDVNTVNVWLDIIATLCKLTVNSCCCSHTHEQDYTHTHHSQTHIVSHILCSMISSTLLSWSEYHILRLFCPFKHL